MENNITLKVQQPWLGWIKAGYKTTEGRPDIPGDRDYMLNKIIEIYNPLRHNDKVNVFVNEVIHYPNLFEYIKGEGNSVAHPDLTFDMIEQIYLNIRSEIDTQVFSPDQLSIRGGINAIRFRLLPN